MPLLFFNFFILYLRQPPSYLSFTLFLSFSLSFSHPLSLSSYSSLIPQYPSHIFLPAAYHLPLPPTPYPHMFSCLSFLLTYLIDLLFLLFPILTLTSLPNLNLATLFHLLSLQPFFRYPGILSPLTSLYHLLYFDYLLFFSIFPFFAYLFPYSLFPQLKFLLLLFSSLSPLTSFSYSRRNPSFLPPISILFSPLFIFPSFPPNTSSPVHFLSPHLVSVRMP